MKLNLHGVVERPGEQVSFEYDLDLSHIEFAQISAMRSPLTVSGHVRNAAGALELAAEIRADLVCICDRCAETYPFRKVIPVTAHLADEVCDETSTDIFTLEGDFIDLDEIAVTAFVLSMDSKSVCKKDCRGLCEKCGANLNRGSCICGEDIDPRLAALQQLLSDEEE